MNFNVLIQCILAGITSIADLKSKLVICKFKDKHKETKSYSQNLIFLLKYNNEQSLIKTINKKNSFV